MMAISLNALTLKKSQVTSVATFETNLAFPGPFTNLTFPSVQFYRTFSSQLYFCIPILSRNYGVLKVYPSITFTAMQDLQDTVEYRKVWNFGTLFGIIAVEL